MEYKFKKVRKQLDNLGYLQVLIPDSLPLVEKLVADLIQTTESLQKYKKISKEVIEERDQLSLGAEPYKCDNAKLVKECNDLHLTFLQIREQSEKIHKDLKRRLATAEREKREVSLECEKLKKRIRDLQFECASKKSGKNSSGVLKSKCKCFDVSSTIAMGDQKVTTLTKEIKKLKDERMHLSEVNETYKTQLSNRDREIERLSQMLVGGRPIQALNQDCCYKDGEGKVSRLQNEVCCLEKDKTALEMQLKESVSKQHEAMRRALHLADRNKKLEQELRNIDHMALAVEADCNNTVKMNAEKVNRMQQKIHDAVLQIQSLEREVSEVKRDKQALLGDVDSLKLEKRHLQAVLETALEDKKRLNDQINQFTIIEHDLNLEIDRLVQTSALQKRKVAELECKLLSDKFDAVTDRSDFPNEEPSTPTKQSPKKSPGKLRKKTPEKSNKGTLFKKPQSQLNKSKPNDLVRGSLSLTEGSLTVKKMAPKLRKEKGSKAPKKKTSLHVESDRRPTSIIENIQVAATTLEDFEAPQNSPHPHPIPIVASHKSINNYDNERETKRHEGPAYCNCCLCNEQPAARKEKLMSDRIYGAEDNRSSIQDAQRHLSQDNQAELRQKLNEKEQLIACLHHENKVLAQEKHNLMTRLETARNTSDDSNSLSLKAVLKRTERERDMLKGDIVRLEEEKDAIRQRLKDLTESQTTEQSKLNKVLMESEQQVRELERERRELMQGQGSRRATISVLEDKCQELTEQGRLCQSELTQQRAMYSQLKTLHEQTDQALADSQAQIVQLEALLERTRSRTQSLEKEKNSYDQEVSTLKSNVKAMRGSLAKIDSEKDGLLISVDDKTEKVSLLEEQLKDKDGQIQQLRSSLTELKQQLSTTMEATTSREQLLRNASVESASLRQEIEAIRRSKENALLENRRLQDDLAASTTDCRCARNEIEVCQRQIEDLKTQLQQYVAEVRRFEDMMTNKEAERNELLDQFRSLSQEAVVLENNNHSLENEATQSKVQLSVTLDHVAELENKLTCQCNLVSGYENQISQLSDKVASLESQLTHTMKQQERAEADLASIRDLCVKLDKQKDTLIRELNDKDDQKVQLDRDVLKMRRDSDALRASLEQDRTSLENLEKLLTDSRQETVQLKLYNQELETEIQALRQKIDEIQSRLVTTTQQLDLYQDRALDYSEQNKQLRRELANERFLLSREGENKRFSATFTCSTNVTTGAGGNQCPCCDNCLGRIRNTGGLEENPLKFYRDNESTTGRAAPEQTFNAGTRRISNLSRRGDEPQVQTDLRLPLQKTGKDPKHGLAPSRKGSPKESRSSLIDFDEEEKKHGTSSGVRNLTHSDERSATLRGTPPDEQNVIDPSPEQAFDASTRRIISSDLPREGGAFRRSSREPRDRDDLRLPLQKTGKGPKHGLAPSRKGSPKESRSSIIDFDEDEEEKHDTSSGGRNSTHSGERSATLRGIPPDEQNVIDPSPEQAFDASTRRIISSDLPREGGTFRRSSREPRDRDDLQLPLHETGHDSVHVLAVPRRTPKGSISSLIDIDQEEKKYTSSGDQSATSSSGNGAPPDERNVKDTNSPGSRSLAESAKEVKGDVNSRGHSSVGADAEYKVFQLSVRKFPKGGKPRPRSADNKYGSLDKVIPKGLKNNSLSMCHEEGDGGRLSDPKSDNYKFRSSFQNSSKGAKSKRAPKDQKTPRKLSDANYTTKGDKFSLQDFLKNKRKNSRDRDGRENNDVNLSRLKSNLSKAPLAAVTQNKNCCPRLECFKGPECAKQPVPLSRINPSKPRETGNNDKLNFMYTFTTSYPQQ